MITAILISFSGGVLFGFFLIAILKAGSDADDLAQVQVMERGIFERDKTIGALDRTVYNQKLKIIEMENKISDLSSKLQLQIN